MPVSIPLGALVENNRLRRTLGVIKAYKTLMGAHRGEVLCTVTTAKVSGVDGFVGMHYCPHQLVIAYR